MTTDCAAIQLIEATKTYLMGETRVTALHGTNLCIQRGEFVAIVGPSGSGKSTLLNLITGIDKPTTGRVLVDGTSLNELDEDRLAKWRGNTIGLVFQFFQLLPTLTAIENVMLPMHFRDTFRGQRRQRATALLEQVGMAERVNHLPAELSGGEQQRVALARALANDPPILLADEPTGNLDTTTSRQIVQLLVNVHQEGKTVLLVTHEPYLASIAQRVIQLQDGRIVQDQTQTHQTVKAY